MYVSKQPKGMFVVSKVSYSISTVQKTQSNFEIVIVIGLKLIFYEKCYAVKVNLPFKFITEVNTHLKIPYGVKKSISKACMVSIAMKKNC